MKSNILTYDNSFLSKYIPTSKSATGFILHGSLVASTLTSALLIIHDRIVLSAHPRERTIIAAVGIVFLLWVEVLFYSRRIRTVNVALVIFYQSLACVTLLLWGLSSPVGLLITSFAVILPGILIGARAITPALAAVICTLYVVYLVHVNGYITPIPPTFLHRPTGWDVAIYGSIFIAIALVARLSVHLREENLRRARHAEAELRNKRDALRTELEKESTALRLEQLRQIHQLHKFALLGQSTAATLHELSNHLSILNLDIDDLRQYHTNSRAISNATDSIEHINRMVRQARRRLNEYEVAQTFNAVPIIYQTIKDLQGKFDSHHIKLVRSRTIGAHSFIVSGSTMALMQIITIFLNNALDACCESTAKHPRVQIALVNKGDSLTISIKDTGPGINTQQQQTLFQPVTSSKSAGLGVGLFIAHNLIDCHFGGTASLQPTSSGAHFIITIPKQKSKATVKK